MTQPIAPRALIALVFSGASFHESFHDSAIGRGSPPECRPRDLLWPGPARVTCGPPVPASPIYTWA